MLKRGNSLPDEDHVMRVIPWSRLRKTEDDVVIGLLPEAFMLREEEEALSVNWIEYFSKDRPGNIKASVHAFRVSLKIGRKAAYAVAKVAKVKEVGLNKQKKIRIVYSPTSNNKSHSSVHVAINDDLALMDALTHEFEQEMYFDSSIV